tara:strand:+ start:238 stop:954 length:717 start_codon:yes stop_codon:yes gene_type:complete
MLGGISSALSALKSFSKKINNTANNVANINSAGFKKRVTSFQESGKLKGVQIASNQAVNTQGPLIPTNNPLNIAVNGRGFLRVGLPDGGTGYTRDGNLKKDSTGRLVTSNGNPVLPEIVIPGNSTGVSISSSGQVSASVNGQNQVIGQIELSSFQNSGGLTSLGSNLFNVSNASGAAVNGNPGNGGLGTIIQGSIESSNVDIVEESVNLITASAGYKANINVIKAQDELLGTILDIKK